MGLIQENPARTATRFPGPPVGWLLVVIGVCLLTAAAFTGPLVGAGGIVLMVLGAVRARSEARREGGPDDRRTLLAARRIAAFGVRHRGSAEGSGPVRAAVESLGQGQHRIVLLAADGTFGDVVVAGADRAEAAIAAAGAVRADATDRDFAGRIRTSEYEWNRMAGMQLEKNRRVG